MPWELGFDPPQADQLVPGRGEVVREGHDGLLVATGPVMLSQAWAASELLTGRGRELGIVAVPWLRDIDGHWLRDVARGTPIFCLDNHYTTGGQGDAVIAALAAQPGAPPVHKLGVDRVPECGTNDEVLLAHRLDAASVAERIEAALPARVS